MNNRDKKNTIDYTLEQVAHHKGAPKSGFFLFLLLFFIAQAIVRNMGRGDFTVNILGIETPCQTLTGVFSSLANLLMILLVVFYRKVGYITTLVVMIGYLPVLLLTVFRFRVPSAIAGVFSTIFVVVAATIIYLNNRRTHKYQKKMEKQAVTDTLTSLPNRYACSVLMNSLMKKGAPFALVSVNLNNFKSINDTMGHEVGNDVLREVASRWKKFADSFDSGTIDFVARVGGDEFSLLIRGYDSEEEVINTIKLYKAELEKKMTFDDCDFYMTACFGYSLFPEDANNSISMFSCSDAALHEVKRLGGTKEILRFTNDLLKTEHYMEIERKLRTALDEGTVYAYFQPQYDMDHKLRGFETLARMKDSEGNFISPGEFIPVAEKSGLIDKLDMRICELAAQFVHDVLSEKDTDMIVSINVSVKHLMKNNFLEELKEVIDKYELPSKNLEVEITESVMIDSDKALKVIEDINKMGIKIAIDDFGTGFSSLNYLNKLPASLLKIDKTFVDAINTDEKCKQYVEAIVSMGHVLDLEVITEGVEEESQIETLKSIGCDLIQGFVWGKPVPVEDAKGIALS